jgi:PadR family transcriptional regulator PadR
MNAERRAQWLKGVLDLCILGTLAEGEHYGYEIARQFERGGLGRIKGGTLYPVLARLEGDGLVASRWELSERGPGRKYYTLTGRGRHDLEELGVAWLEFASAIGTLVRDVRMDGGRA